MKKLVVFISVCCFSILSYGQIHEIGVFAGGSNYIGDIGRENFIYPNNFMGGVLYKRNLNPRIALRGNFTYAKISDDDNNSNNLGRYNRGISFTNSVKELAVGIEFNFFEYNLDNFQMTHTPYILFQLGVVNYDVVNEEVGVQQYDYTTKTSITMPFGVGYKFKITEDFAGALEVRAQYLWQDDLDYNHKEIESLSYGDPNDNDWYILTGISFVYTFGRPPCYTTPR